MIWSDFFPAETAVQALPSWSAPRLYIPAKTAGQRWRRSKFYPAYRKSAMGYRYALRVIKTVAGDGRTTPANNGEWLVSVFLKDVAPDVSSVSVLVGTAGPAQKTTLQLCDASDATLGYIKYGETPAAIAGIKNEGNALGSIQTGLGPELLKEGPFGSGYAIATSNIDGEAVPATLPPIAPVLEFQKKLLRPESHPVTGHPGLAVLEDEITLPWYASLQDRDWPLSVQHGDYAPWNLKLVDGSIKAFDWEYATTTGFPYLDCAFFSLQTDVKIYRVEPAAAYRRAKGILTGFDGLSEVEASTIVRLSARDAYNKGLADGHKPEDFLQDWYRGVWEAAL